MSNACNRNDSGISTMKVSVSYDTVGSTTNSDNLRYCDMSNDKEVINVVFTWNGEMEN